MRRFFTIVMFCTLCFLSGVLVGKKEYPPYPFLRDTFQRWFLAHNFDRIPENALLNNVSEQVSFHSAAELELHRAELKKYIWGDLDVSTLMPSQIEKSIDRKSWPDLHALARVDRITIPIEQQITSTALLFVPQKPNQQLIIYHEGHKASCAERHELLKHFLNEGFTLACLDMPLTGINSGSPVISTKRFGKIQLYNHDRLQLADQPFRYFLDPVVTLLNFFEKEHFTHVSMFGFSGGGWTTVLASALDVRIEKSFSVAGSTPHYLRGERQSEWGDFEQHFAPLYRIANYPELYLMATSNGRTHLQVTNRYDTCCFGGVGYQSYASTLQTLAKELTQGELLMLEDNSHHQHQLSGATLFAISQQVLHAH